MSKLLSVRQTVERLNQLKASAHDFALSKQEADQELIRKTALETRRCEEAGEALAQKAALALQTEQESYASRKAARLSRYQARTEKIGKAHRQAKQGLQIRIEREEGRRKYRIQKAQLDAERTRKKDLAENNETLSTFQNNLTENREGFLGLEEDAIGAFRGYSGLQKLLTETDVADTASSEDDEYRLLEQLVQLQSKTMDQLGRFRRRFLPAVFRVFPAWLIGLFLVVLHGALVPAMKYFQIEGVTYEMAGLSLGVCLGLLLLVYFLGKSKARPLAVEIARGLDQARHWHNACLDMAEQRHGRREREIQAACESRLESLNQEWEQVLAEASTWQETWPPALEEKAARIKARHERMQQETISCLEETHGRVLQETESEKEQTLKELEEARDVQLARFQTEHEGQCIKLQTAWDQDVAPLLEKFKAARQEALQCFPDWDDPGWDQWTPPKEFIEVAQFASLQIDLPRFCAATQEASDLVLPEKEPIIAPLVLTYPKEGSILLETEKSGEDEAAAGLNNIMLRLFSKVPPGRVSFTIIDPVKLGQNFAGIMHLTDFEENLINRRIWTQSAEIDQRLADLNEQMEKVIQMYLRNEYETIADYNRHAGSIAEKFHFLVVADFPTQFSETALQRLHNIASSGARCGVYTLIHHDRRQPPAHPGVLDALRENSVCLEYRKTGFFLLGNHDPGVRLLMDPSASPDRATEFLRMIGESSKDSGRVEVPFSQVTPEPAAFWSVDTTEELQVPIGRTGATKLQYLSVGKGTRQHALIAGKTGSGKSTLFHVLITNLAMWCPPDQVEFYLIDFKKGVEFKCYATRHLPHARVIAIESDREFGLSVLQRVDEELRRRGDLFRKLGVQDVAGYKRAGGKDPMPRSLLIIDEFQEFFVEDDRISQDAAVLMDRIVRQGRAFGIHVLLGSQTLGGAFTLARTTIGQMVIRIALQCNEADAYLIMDDTNPAPRLLTRPGEGIYNDMAGALEGNSPFQTVWLPDDERDECLDKISAHAKSVGGSYAKPFVFEGNAPADIEENELLRQALASPAASVSSEARIWLGSPNAIKGPTEVRFVRQAGNHLLMVGQREEAVVAILTAALVSLAAQVPVSQARFIVVDSSPQGSTYQALLQKATGLVPHAIVLARASELAGVMNELSQEMKQRSEGDSSSPGPAIFLLIHGIQNFKKLRQEEDFGFSLEDSGPEAKPSAQLNDLICEGSALGIHVMASCDTYNNVNRFLTRKALSEFEMRVVFQMSANDSASLIDSPKAGNLGLHRALFYNAHEGSMETFRPYSLPPSQWLDEAAEKLGDRR